MNLRKNLAFNGMLLALALVATVAQASAQMTSKGTFTLAEKARVGGVLLQPGQYTIFTELMSPFIYIDGKDGRKAALIGSVETKEPFDQNRLIFKNVDGIPSLHQFDAGVVGKSYSFLLPKAKRYTVASNGGPLETTLAVTASR